MNPSEALEEMMSAYGTKVLRTAFFYARRYLFGSNLCE
jgi:hypothetical protein